MHRYKKKLLQTLFKYDHVIWDWNGTLLDDSDLVLDINNRLLIDHGLPEITRTEYRMQFCHPVKDYYIKIGFDMDKVSFEEIGMQFVRLYEENLASVSIFQGAHEILQAVKERKIGQWILSAGHQDHVRQMAKRFKIEHFFAQICGIHDHYAASKVQRGRELMEEIGADPSRIILVGDTDHDFEVAQALGIDVLLVANGHQCLERLQRLTKRVLGG